MRPKTKCRHHQGKFNAKRHDGCAALAAHSYSSLVNTLQFSVDVSLRTVCRFSDKNTMQSSEVDLSNCFRFAGRANICGVLAALRGRGDFCSTDDKRREHINRQ